MIHLDTNVLIALLTGRKPSVVSAFQKAAASGALFAISDIVLHELRFGASNSSKVLENNTRIYVLLSAQSIDVLAFDHEDADHAGDIRACLKQIGTPIGPYDVLIAAQARCRGATLITTNLRAFQRVPGLKVEEWGDVPAIM